MNIEDIAALRELLVRARAAGYAHTLIKLANGPHEHAWRKADWYLSEDVSGWVTLYQERLHIVPPGAHSDEWLVPAHSVLQVVTVLEMAGALPPKPVTS